MSTVERVSEIIVYQRSLQIQAKLIILYLPTLTQLNQGIKTLVQIVTVLRQLENSISNSLG